MVSEKRVVSNVYRGTFRETYLDGKLVGVETWRDPSLEGGPYVYSVHRWPGWEQVLAAMGEDLAE